MALYAFDGTWQKPDETETNDTNVFLFHRLYEAHSADKEFYVEGVGTRHRTLGRVVGGAAGTGGLLRILEAYSFLCEEWAEGDHTIDIVGFSRGAALALSFANFIARRGVRNPETDQVVAARPPIRFLGLWDVVGSFGIPINVGLLDFQQLNLGYDLSLAPNVEHCFHAMALEERRQTFAVTRVPGAYEVWFRGVHSDVGGGQNRVLSNLALRWMVSKAIAAGLPIRPTELARLDADLAASRTAPNALAVTRGDRDLIKQSFREIFPQDKVHHSVASTPDCNNPPGTCFIETAAEEAIAQRVG